MDLLNSLYDTQLNTEQQSLFDALNKQYMENGGRNLYDDRSDYDIQGAFADGILANLLRAKRVHLPDTYKKPNHITFSDQSQYSTPETPGGIWDRVGKQDRYTPSDYVLSQHSPAEMREYFRQYEPNSILNIVMSSDWR